MSKYNFQYRVMTMIFFIYCGLLAKQEFVINKKDKTKKEIALHVKEDIVELYESALRQIGSNIQQSVVVQNYIIDNIKRLMENNSQSTAQLKALRAQLEKSLKILEEQQADLQNFLMLNVVKVENSVLEL